MEPWIALAAAGLLIVALGLYLFWRRRDRTPRAGLPTAAPPPPTSAERMRRALASTRPRPATPPAGVPGPGPGDAATGRRPRRPRGGAGRGGRRGADHVVAPRRYPGSPRRRRRPERRAGRPRAGDPRGRRLASRVRALPAPLGDPRDGGQRC